MKRVVLLGAYAALSAADLPIDDIVSRIGDSNYTGVSIMAGIPHVMKGPGKNLHPYRFDAASGVFTMKNPAHRKNIAFYDRLQELAEKLFSNGLDLKYCFFNQYQDIATLHWKKHPYRTNDIGINWNGSGVQGRKPLYDSYTSGPDTFYWLRWTPINEHKLQWNFSTLGMIGDSISEFIRESCRILSKAFKDNTKGSRLLWVSANEQKAVLDPVTGHPVNSKSAGDRSEIFAYISEAWKSFGLEPDGKKFFSVVSRDCDLSGSPAQQAVARNIMFTSITRAYGVSDGLGALHEVHIKTTAERQSYIQDSGMLPAKSLFSDDSGRDKVEFRKLYLAGDPFFDQLFEEGIWAQPPAPVYQFEDNFRTFWPNHKRLVK